MNNNISENFFHGSELLLEPLTFVKSQGTLISIPNMEGQVVTTQLLGIVSGKIKKFLAETLTPCIFSHTEIVNKKGFVGLTVFTLGVLDNDKEMT